MTTDLVDNAWAHIEKWLRKHASRTYDALNPPAREAEIQAAEAELGVGFPPDLVASLRRHDGSAPGDDELLFTTDDRLLSVREIVDATRSLRRGVAALDLAEEQAAAYWHPCYVKFASYDITADGLLLDCRPAHPTYGAVGRFFDGSGTTFGHADSLGAHLAGLADEWEAARVSGA